MTVGKNLQIIFHIVSSLGVIFVGTVRSITTVPKTVFRVPQLPCWTFFLHSVVQIMRAFIALHVLDIRVLRAVTDFPIIPTIPRNVFFEKKIINRVDCEVIVPGKRSSTSCIDTALSNGAGGICIYFHGGGFALCTSAFHRPITHFFAQKTDVVVVVPNYRRLPEHTLGEALEDCENVFQELRDQYPKVKICIAGDSAGGALCVMLAEKKREQIAAVSLLSPWCDFRDRFSDLPKFWGSHDYLSPDVLVTMGGMVVDRNKEDLKSPIEIVCAGDYPSNVPTLVQVGGAETLYPQINRFSKYIQSSEFRAYPNMIHVPHFFSIMHDEATKAIFDLCEFNRKHLLCEIAQT